MKKVQLSEHVWRLGSWMIVPMNVWVILAEKGVTLIDAGISSMAKGIVQFIEELDAGPLERIVLTHGHSDHVGSIRKILARYPVPVYANGVEIPYMEGQIPYPGRKKADAFVEPQLVQPLKEDGQGELLPVGDLIPYRTPGHSPGHVVYYHRQDNVLLAGDLFTSSRGQLRRPIPIFTADMTQAVESGSIVKELKADIMSVCHGSDVVKPHEQYDTYKLRWGDH